MKKLIKIVVAISLITMVLISCSNDDTDNTSNIGDVENVDLVPIQDEQTDTENNHSDESSGILYENYDFGFSMRIPSSWEEKYSIRVLEDTYGDEGTISAVTFYHNATMDELGSDVGWLFSFMKVTGEHFTEEEPPIMAGQTIILEQTGGYTYFVKFPSGVEYNEEVGSESAIEYKEMKNQVDFFIDTFMLIEK